MTSVASFRESSHCVRWIFSNLPLTSNSYITNLEKIEEEIKENFDPAKANLIPKKTLSFEQIEKLLIEYNVQVKFTEKDLLTWSEEFHIINDSINKMILIMDNIQIKVFPKRVKATAVLYFRRFFSKNSVMEWNVTNILIACIFAASKTEEFHINIEDLTRIITNLSGNIKQDDILSSELVLMDGLNFDLRVLHPYRIMIAYIHNIWSTSNIKEELLLSCNNTIDDILFNTNAALVYTPGIIALGSILAVLKKNENLQENIEIFINHIKLNFPNDANNIISSIEKISECALDLPVIPKPNKLKKIMRKLKPIFKEIDKCKLLAQEKNNKEKEVEEEEKRKKKEIAAKEYDAKTQAFLMSTGENSSGKGLFG